MNQHSHKIYPTLKQYSKITLYSAFALTFLVAPFLRKKSEQDPYNLREDSLHSIANIVKEGKLRKGDILNSLAYFEITPQKLEEIVKNIQSHQAELLELAKINGANIGDIKEKEIQALLQATSSRFTQNDIEYLKEARKYLLLNKTQIDNLIKKINETKTHTGAESKQVILFNLLILSLFIFSAYKYDQVTDEIKIIENRNKYKKVPASHGTEHLDSAEARYFMLLLASGGTQLMHAVYKAVDILLK
jgi:hypothetical protein